MIFSSCARILLFLNLIVVDFLVQDVQLLQINILIVMMLFFDHLILDLIVKL